MWCKCKLIYSIMGWCRQQRRKGLAIRACHGNRRKEEVTTSEGDDGVGNKAREGKGQVSFFSFWSRTFTLIRLIPLVFLDTVDVWTGCLILGLKRSNLIFLPLCSNWHMLDRSYMIISLSYNHGLPRIIWPTSIGTTSHLLVKIKVDRDQTLLLYFYSCGVNSHLVRVGMLDNL